MANYSLVSTSKFNPFSYEQLAAPLMQATQAHQQLEESIGELSSKANVWENMANQTTDRRAYAQYKKYSDDLRAQAQNLIQNGITPGSRQAMLDLKSRYSSEIAPIEMAYTRRQQLADEQRKLKQSDPTMMFERDASTMSLDEFLDNPNTTAGSSYSGDLLTKQASAAASNLARTLTAYGKGQAIDAFTDSFIKQHGIRPQDVNAIVSAIQDPNSSAHDTVLGAIMDSVMGSSGIASWADSNTLNRAYDYIGLGAYSAIGNSDVSLMDNFIAKQSIKDTKTGGKEIPSPYQTNPTLREMNVPIGLSRKEWKNLKKGNGADTGIPDYDSFKTAEYTVPPSFSSEVQEGIKQKIWSAAMGNSIPRNKRDAKTYVLQDSRLVAHNNDSSTISYEPQKGSIDYATLMDKGTSITNLGFGNYGCTADIRTADGSTYRVTLDNIDSNTLNNIQQNMQLASKAIEQATNNSANLTDAYWEQIYANYQNYIRACGDELMNAFQEAKPSTITVDAR